MEIQTVIRAKRTLCLFLFVVILFILAILVGSGCTNKFCPAYDKYHSVHKYYGMSDKVMYYSPNDYNHGRTRY